MQAYYFATMVQLLEGQGISEAQLLSRAGGESIRSPTEFGAGMPPKKWNTNRSRLMSTGPSVEPHS